LILHDGCMHTLACLCAGLLWKRRVQPDRHNREREGYGRVCLPHGELFLLVVM